MSTNDTPTPRLEILIPVDGNFIFPRYPNDFVEKYYVANRDNDLALGVREWTGPGGHWAHEYRYTIFRVDAAKQIAELERELAAANAKLTHFETAAYMCDMDAAKAQVAALTKERDTLVEEATTLNGYADMFMKADAKRKEVEVALVAMTEAERRWRWFSEMRAEYLQRADARLAVLAKEPDRLTGYLIAANKNHEHFEREWNLAKDRTESVEADNAVLRERVRQATLEKGEWVAAQKRAEVSEEVAGRLRAAAQIMIDKWAGGSTGMASLYEGIVVLDKALALTPEQIGGELAQTKTHLQNLLARIHRDGGHYTAEHGLERSCADAETKVVETGGELAALREDKALLDFLESQAIPGIGWVSRMSGRGRGYRLHQGDEDHATARDALRAARKAVK